MRKLGIGLTFILQSVSGLREGIWKQTSVRLIGYGLTEGSDLKRLANIVGEQHMRLYLSTAGPEATGRYPFMIAGGGATGLSFGTKPVFLDMLTEPANFLAYKQDWIAKQRRQYAHLLPAGDRGGELMSMPERPTGDAYLEGVRHAQGLRKGAAKRRRRETSRQRRESPEGSVRHHPPRRPPRPPTTRGVTPRSEPRYSPKTRFGHKNSKCGHKNPSGASMRRGWRGCFFEVPPVTGLGPA